MSHAQEPAERAERQRVERWCAEAGFVRSLAADLVADVHRADDVAQESWVRALCGAGPRGPFRAWIATVVRNVAVAQGRREARSRRHEAAAARAEVDAAPDPAAAVERLEMHERLLAAVRALDEPYRSAIVARYCEGLAPRAIAARSGVPVRTVHTRLQRALAQLRARLGKGDDQRAALALLAAAPPGAVASLSVPAVAAALFAMTTKTKLSFAALFVALLAAVAVPRWSREPDLPAPSAPDPVAAAAAPAASGAVAAGEPARRESVARAAAEGGAGAAATAARAAEPWVVRGVLLALDGTPLRGLAVALTPFGKGEPAQRAITGAGGAFALELPDVLGGHVDVDDAAWTTAYRPVLWGNRDVGELTVVAVAAAPIAGTVTDAAGQPIAGAQVSVTGALPPRAGYARSLERALPGAWTATSDETGAFALPRGPVLPDLRIQASATGWRALQQALDRRVHMHLVLERAPVLVGRVVDAEGRPIEAAVFCHPAGAMSDADGRFELDVANVSSPWLVAARQGQLPARVRCENGAPTDPSAWPQPLVLRLGGPPLAISGRALAADGSPLPSPSVTLLDPECLVPGNTMSSIEFLARVHSRITEHGAEFWEGAVGGVGGGDGAFSIGGLQDRSYRLVLEHRAALQRVETGPIRAGARDVELRLPAEPMWTDLGGVVVDRRGAGVAGASVWLERLDAGTGEARTTDALTTDAEGRFRHGAVASQGTRLCVQTPGTAHPVRFDPARFGDTAALRVTAPVATKVRIETLADADAAAFVDADGEPVAATITQGDSAWGAFDVPLTTGRSEVVAVPDHAVLVVLKCGGREVARMPVDLRPGDLQVLRP